MIKPTPRENEIIELIIDGYTNMNIAQHHGVSENTVKRQVMIIFQKMGVMNRTELAVKVLRKRHAEEIESLRSRYGPFR